ncbi:hypothetical protein YTPLAS72_12640 [Nitrospira sp.]|nr:hypothetical protein YTPLAS72_12640 [Nitrospira sp.]
MDFQSVNSQETGILYLTLKPRLLKCTIPGISAQENKAMEIRREDYVPIKFLDNHSRDI